MKKQCDKCGERFPVGDMTECGCDMYCNNCIDGMSEEYFMQWFDGHPKVATLRARLALYEKLEQAAREYVAAQYNSSSADVVCGMSDAIEDALAELDKNEVKE